MRDAPWKPCGSYDPQSRYQSLAVKHAETPSDSMVVERQVGF
jgi:hypothetical protein